MTFFSTFTIQLKCVRDLYSQHKSTPELGKPGCFHENYSFFHAFAATSQQHVQGMWHVDSAQHTNEEKHSRHTPSARCATISSGPAAVLSYTSSASLAVLLAGDDEKQTGRPFKTGPIWLPFRKHHAHCGAAEMMFTLICRRVDFKRFFLHSDPVKAASKSNFAPVLNDITKKYLSHFVNTFPVTRVLDIPSDRLFFSKELQLLLDVKCNSAFNKLRDSFMDLV